MGMHVVLFGNPMRGFEVIGPFKTFEDAQKWADGLSSIDDCDYWIAPLGAPDFR